MRSLRGILAGRECWQAAFDSSWHDGLAELGNGESEAVQGSRRRLDSAPSRRWRKRSANKSGVIVMAERIEPLPRNCFVSQLVNKVGHVPRETVLPNQSPTLPAPLVLQEASRAWSLLSRRPQVTRKNNGAMPFSWAVSPLGMIKIWQSVARVRSRKEAFDATQNLAVVLSVVSISDPTETCVELDWWRRAVDV